VLEDITIRPLNERDSLDELTDLLHRAYRPLAEAGLRYLATHQDVEMTRRRIAKGECYVGALADRLVATITFVPARSAGGAPWYDRPDVASFTQFCVEPDLTRRGIGSMLLDLVEERARATGAAEIACDTAEPATHLIELYERRGYRSVAQTDWRPVTNYTSVILSKVL